MSKEEFENMYYYKNFERYGDKLAAIQEDGSKITYRELKETSEKVGSAAQKRSIVFCLCTNTIACMSGYLSFLDNEIVPLMLDAEINEVLLNNLMDIYAPTYLYVPEYNKERFCNCTEILNIMGYVLLKTSYNKRYELDESLALLLTTSGSTGSPKLVRQSYTNVQSNAEAIAEYLELDESERPITTLPMNYTYGLSVINSHILVGATILLTTQTILTKPFWDFLKDNKATSFAGVPYTYEQLKRVRFFRMDLPSLKSFTQAGGKLQPELHKEFAEYAQDRGKRFIVMYGQTEATARMAYLPYDKSLEKYGSMGIPIPGGKFVLVDSNNNIIEDADVVGELVYEGPNVTLGYAQKGEDLAKGDERGGRLETGDMAKRDVDGFYYIVGRKKRFLKLFGNRVNLDEIDRMIKKEFPQIDSASTGTDELMKIYVTDSSCADEVKHLIEDRTHINSRAISVIVIDEIPRNESGKILYKDL